MQKGKISVSSTAEYFAKNLQQVGFSSPTKAVLTTLKEAVDNSLDACEEAGILPEIHVVIKKEGRGSLRNTDQILVRVEDNGPGIQTKDIAKVFGEYLASSKFGKGRCSRGQQGIGISAATTWAMQTSAKGVRVITKTAKQKLAVDCRVQVDLKLNKGHVKDQKEIKWDREHGTSVEFLIDGRVQLNGEAGIIAFLRSNVLVNPHLTIHYDLMDQEKVSIERVSDFVPKIPEALAPHPHTMKLGEFLGHARLFGNISINDWLSTAFSRLTPDVLKVLSGKVKRGTLNKLLHELKDQDFKELFMAIQDCELKPPSTKTVLSIGEEGLAKSILRLGDVDYFSVVTRKPTICDFKPIQIEVALARLIDKNNSETEDQVQIIRFANRVPLQFDKASCAIVKGISSVNWKSYGMRQGRNTLPYGPYIVAVSLVSPFIKFKNASKETVDASDELVDEIRKALMHAGQRLSRHLRKEHKENALESKLQHIEKFAPILVEGLVRITNSDDIRKDKAHKGLLKLLGRETDVAEKELEIAEHKLDKHLKSRRKRLGHVALILEQEADQLSRDKLDGKSSKKKSKGKDLKKKNSKGVEEDTKAPGLKKVMPNPKESSVDKPDMKKTKKSQKTSKAAKTKKVVGKVKPASKVVKKTKSKVAKNVSKKSTKPKAKPISKPKKKVVKAPKSSTKTKKTSMKKKPKVSKKPSQKKKAKVQAKKKNQKGSKK